MKSVTLHIMMMSFVIGCASERGDSPGKAVPHQLSEADFFAFEDGKFDAPCAPGADLGICQACDESGRLRARIRDDACADLDCSGLNHFSLFREGDEFVCMAISYGVTESACGTDGRCARSASVDTCQIDERQVIERVVGPCSTIVGCDSSGAPRVQAAADGLKCPGGECLSGQCTAAERPVDALPIEPSAQCGMFPASPFCGEGQDGVIPYCEFRVETPDFRSCEEVCADAGSWCLGAWDDERNTCAHQERQSCTARELDQVCRCAQPHITEGEPFGQ